MRVILLTYVVQLNTGGGGGTTNVQPLIYIRDQSSEIYISTYVARYDELEAHHFFHGSFHPLKK
jgi:hypothetical protein